MFFYVFKLISSYLFKEDPLFNAYVCISPDLTGTVRDYLGKRLEFFKDDIFYYMATSDKDLPYIRDAVLNADSQISEVKNQYLTYYFDDFKNDTHYTLVNSAIAKSFDKIFELYKPLREKELEEKVLTYEGTLDKYLVDRYDRIEDLFGIKKPITEEEVKRAKANLLKQYDQISRNSAFLGTYMSEFIGAGDWRLAFIHRDRVENMTAEKVNAAVQRYLINTQPKNNLYHHILYMPHLQVSHPLVHHTYQRELHY